MPPSKKKKSAHAHKVKARGVWIAPDLERTIKGAGGRRGLTDPPYGYYLQLADLVLKPVAPESPSVAPKTTSEREEEFTERPLVSGLDLAMPSRLGADSSPSADRALGSSAAMKTSRPKPPKLALPRPPRSPLLPKPPKLSAAKPPVRPAAPKPPRLSVPKPPKRRR